MEDELSVYVKRMCSLSRKNCIIYSIEKDKKILTSYEMLCARSTNIIKDITKSVLENGDTKYSLCLDVSNKVTEIFVDYIDSNDGAFCSISVCDILDLLEIANKYEMGLLKTKIGNILFEYMDDINKCIEIIEYYDKTTHVYKKMALTSIRNVIIKQPNKTHKNILNTMKDSVKLIVMNYLINNN